MTGQAVIHTRFGRGVVTRFEPPRIGIRFEDGADRTFAYPQAVGRFIRFEDPDAARRAGDDARRAEITASEQARVAVEARRRREEAIMQERAEAFHLKKVAAAKKVAANRRMALERKKTAAK